MRSHSTFNIGEYDRVYLYCGDKLFAKKQRCRIELRMIYLDLVFNDMRFSGCITSIINVKENSEHAFMSYFEF